MDHTSSAAPAAPPPEDFRVNDLVYITSAGHEWICRTKGPAAGALFLVGRVAIVQDVYDWTSDRGRAVLDKRRSTGKWEALDPLLFKYVLMIMFPELSSNGKLGMGLPEVMPYMHPLSGGTQPLFLKYPSHLADLITGARRFK